MTDAMLRLARAVYPGLAYQVTTDMRVGFNGVYVSSEKFDPATNADQSCDVLAWIACQADVHINGECVATQRWVCKHDGTAAGIRAAVVEAAMRVAQCHASARAAIKKARGE